MRLLLIFILLISSECFALNQANFSIVSSGDMSSDIISHPILLEQMTISSVQASWSGSSVGFLKLQVSNELGRDQSGVGVSTWSDVVGSSAVVSGFSSDFSWNYPNVGYRWMRLFYNKLSKSGILNARANVKGQ